MTEARWNNEYDMCSLDGGRTWRGFARHHPSGEVFIIAQDNTPGHEANYVSVGGPYHHTKITRAFLANANLDDIDNDWASEQIWQPVSLPEP